MSGWELVAGGLVLGAAALAQSVSGFGYSLLAVPVLALLTTSVDAVVVAAVAGVPLSPLVLRAGHHHVDRPAARTLVLASLLGMPIGLVVLDRASDDGLRLVIGVVVIALAVLLTAGFRIRRGHRGVDVVTGFVSGALATSTGTNGPPLVFGLQARGVAPDAFRSTLAAVFTVSSVVTLALFLAAGQLDADRTVAGVVALPFVVSGWAAGTALARRVRPAHVRPMVLALLFLSGASAILGALA